MTLSSQVNATLHQGIISEWIFARVLWGRTSSLLFKDSEEARFFWSHRRTCTTQREELVVTAASCFSQVQAGRWCLFVRPLRGRVSESHRWSAWQAACMAQGLRDWSGESAWPVASHLESTDMGLSCNHVWCWRRIWNCCGYSDKERWCF